MKKYTKIITAAALLVFPINVFAASNANTIAELRQELAAYKAKKSSAEYQKNRTQNEINSSKNSISSAQSEIETNQKKIADAKEEIKQLTAEIDNTKSRIDDLMRTSQVMKGDNGYLEYIFGASSISEFIVRISISSQLASYSDDLITGYQDKIETNEQLKKDLINREETLNAKIESLESNINTLGKSLTSYVAEALSADEDIASTQKLIDYYKKLGCGENENLMSCVSVKGDTKFIKPLNKGTITSYYGYRTHPVTGVAYSFHTGLDIGGNSEGTNVYAAANGIVGKIVRGASCGGNQVYVHHTINGVKYTTLYMHLLNINVKVGDSVNTNTVVGHVGGYSTSKSRGGYDGCTTGAHLHFSIAKGWYGSTYVSYSTFVSNLVNPRNIITFPSMGTFFYTRF